MKTIKINNFEENCYYEKIENGLEIYMVPLINKKSFTALFGTKYGGADLEYKKNDQKIKTPAGIAHFLEHKLFDTNEISPFDFYSKSGTDVNAYTTPDYTAFHFSGSTNFQENLKYLLNWVTNFKTTKDKVEKERGIILEEERMYLDNPDRILYESIRENTLQKDYRRIKVIGTKEDIKSITKEEIEECYHNFYRPDNMFLVIVGNIDAKKTLDLIKEELKNWHNPDSKIEKIICEEPDEVLKESETKYLNVTVPKVAYTIKINKTKLDKYKLDSYELDCYLSMILSICFGSASDFREYLLLNGLFNTVSYQITETDTHYLIDFFATSGKPEQLIKELENYLKNIKISEEDMERIKKVWIAGEVRTMDNIDSIVNNIIDDILDYKHYINNKIDIIKKLKYQVLNKIVHNLDFSNKSWLIIMPNQ